MQVWDTAGQERFRNITTTYYKGASGIVLVDAIDNKQSFRNVESWVRQIQNTVGEDIPLTLVDSKSDLEEKRMVNAVEVAEYVKSHEMVWCEMSAKTGSRVPEPFKTLA